MKELEQPAKISPTSAINSSWVGVWGGGRKPHFLLLPSPANQKPTPKIQTIFFPFFCFVGVIFFFFCSFLVPGRLSHQHGPVQLALDVGVARAAGVHEGVDGHQHEALSVEVPHLDRQLPHRGQAKH